MAAKIVNLALEIVRANFKLMKVKRSIEVERYMTLFRHLEFGVTQYMPQIYEEHYWVVGNNEHFITCVSRPPQ